MDTIERHFASNLLDVIKVKVDNGEPFPYEYAKRFIEKLPSAQRTGKWLDANICGELPVIVCDQCNTFYPLSFGDFHNFCPNCGADMRGEEN